MEKSPAESVPKPHQSIRESDTEKHETHQSAAATNPQQSQRDATEHHAPPTGETAPAKISCHRCGIESTRPELFCDEPRSFSSKVHKICPQCWAKKDSAGGRSRLWLIGALVTLGAICVGLWPDNPAGWIMLNLAWLDISLALAVVPHEFAHAAVAKAVGYRVFRIIIGSGKVWWRGTIFGFPVEARIFPFVGFAMAAPRDPQGVRWKNFLFILAGPLANVAMFALAATALRGRTVVEMMEQPFWGWQLVAVANLVIVVASLCPYRLATGLGVISSDGLQLLNFVFRWKKDTAEVQHAAGFLLETQLCNETQRYEEADAWIERGLALYPEYVPLLQLRSHAFIRTGQLEKARLILLSLLDKFPTPSTTRLIFMNDIAYVDALLDTPELLPEADRYSADALAGIPWHPALQNTRGVVLLALDRLDEALPLLRAGAEAARDNADHSAQCQSVLALGEARAGHLAAAEQALQAARTAAPDCFLIPRAEAAILSRRRHVAAADASSHPVPGAD